VGFLHSTAQKEGTTYFPSNFHIAEVFTCSVELAHLLWESKDWFWGKMQMHQRCLAPNYLLVNAVHISNTQLMILNIMHNLMD